MDYEKLKDTENENNNPLFAKLRKLISIVVR